MLIYFFAARTNECEYLDKLVRPVGVRLMIRGRLLLMVYKKRDKNKDFFLVF